MKNKVFILKFMHILGFYCLIILQLNCQNYNNNYSPTIIPSSPTSSVFLKYGSHQPSLSTGTINIPIPLYELNVADYKLPITLTYSTSGINYMDKPYPVGYGWVLGPGLRITRQIMGRPDDLFPMKSTISGSESCQFLKAGIIDENYANFHGIRSEDLYDTQYDIFTVQLPSGNYNFLLDKVNDVYQVISYNNFLKIEPIVIKGTIKGFTVFDNDGTKYIFGNNLESQSLWGDYIEMTSFPYSCPTAYMMRQVTLSNNQTINFSWKKVKENGNRTAVVTDQAVVVKYNKAETTIWNTGFSSVSDVTVEDIGGQNTTTFSYDDFRVLDKIEFPYGEISFIYKSDTDPFVTNILVQDKNNNLLKNINFLYEDGDINSNLLNCVKIDDQVYRFTYNPNRFYRNTKGLDYWGYYNGKDIYKPFSPYNINLIPKMEVMVKYAHMNFATGGWPIPVGNADRSISQEYMQAYMLTRIDYPTGGYSEFEYEPHRFENQYTSRIYAEQFSSKFDPVNQGGGLRVTKITSKVNKETQAIVKTYKYGNNENGLANIVGKVPTLDTFTDLIDVYSPYSGGAQTLFESVLTINNFSSYTNSNFNITPFWYDCVTEYSSEGKTEYYFAFVPSIWDEIVDPKLYVINTYNMFQPYPYEKKKITYKKNGSIYKAIEEVSSIYEMVSAIPIRSNYIARTCINGGITPCGEGFDFTSIGSTSCLGLTCLGQYLVKPYLINMQYRELKEKEIISYSNNGDSIKKSETYEYSYNGQIGKIISSVSNSNLNLIKEYKYLNDYKDPVYTEMSKYHIIRTPIEEITYKGTTEIERVKRNYTNNISITNGLIRPLSIQSSNIGSIDLQTQVAFDKYDKYGNLLQCTMKDGTIVSYLWSYNYQYPIAEIKNATYIQVVDKLTQILVDRVALAYTPSDADLQAIVALRTSLPQSQVTTYTYKPLVGMASATDPRGQVTKYEYDGAGRLSTISLTEDGRDKVIKNYSYQMPGYPNPGDTEYEEPKPEPVPIPDPYQKGKTGEMTLWVASADPNYGIYAYDYDNNKEMGQYDGSWKTYPTIGIGEYEVTTKNLTLHYRNKWSVAMGWVNYTQDIINQMNRGYNGTDNVDLATFLDINGSYVSLYKEASSYMKNFKVFDKARTNELAGWDLMGSADFFQLFGQAPTITSNPVTNVMNFLGANKADVPTNYTADWFEYKNTSGFTMTPLGRRHSNEAGDKDQKWFGYKVESTFRLKDYPEGMILFNRDQGISINPYLYHFSQARYSRAKTDQELGYKMYIDNCNDSVVMYPVAKTTKLTELPKGLERGIALRYSNKSLMKVYRKWSEIVAEATNIRNAIPAIPAMQTLPVSPCEEPEVILPDPYEKGQKGEMTLWVASADPNYGLYAYDYDNNKEMGQYDGSWKTYPTIGIGEYEVTTKNLTLHYRNKWSVAMGWVNYTQDIINQMNRGYNGTDNVDLATFLDINGSYVSLYNEASSYMKNFKVFDKARTTQLAGWDLMSSADFFQMMGQAPAVSSNPVANTMNFLGANKADVPTNYTADWFEYKNTSGFTMVPLGRRHSAVDGFEGQKWFNYKVESTFRLKDYPTGMILFNRDQGISINPYLYHFCQARYSRPKTDQELGYKMYIDVAKDAVIMLPYDQASSLPELPRGAERGVALRYANRKALKVLKKWSEIQAEAAKIKSTITGL